MFLLSLYMLLINNSFGVNNQYPYWHILCIIKKQSG